MNLTKMLLKRVLRTVKFGFRKIYHGILNDIEYYRLVAALKLHKYVPMYFKRTAAEHNEIRLKIRRRQDQCPHIKGGYPRSAFRDFNVFDHTYINGSRIIGCMTCRKKWTPTSREWKLALSMAEQSSNIPSASERPVGIVTIDAEGKRTVRPIAQEVKE